MRASFPLILPKLVPLCPNKSPSKELVQQDGWLATLVHKLVALSVDVLGNDGVRYDHEDVLHIFPDYHWRLYSIELAQSLLLAHLVNEKSFDEQRVL